MAYSWRDVTDIRLHPLPPIARREEGGIVSRARQYHSDSTVYGAAGAPLPRAGRYRGSRTTPIVIPDRQGEEYASWTGSLEQVTDRIVLMN